MVSKSRRQSTTSRRTAPWSKQTELVSVVLKLVPPQDSVLYPQYTIGLHAWWLDQVRQTAPKLSSYLHDGESEKPFAMSGLVGNLMSSGRSPKVLAGEVYEWTISALSNPVAQWMAGWVDRLPSEVGLRNAPLSIVDWRIEQSATTYRDLWAKVDQGAETVVLRFISPTSFRRKGHHFPLPVPTNVFHSYLRRWNDFSGQPIDQEAFLEWVDQSILILRHRLESVKTVAGKRGMVTGFVGSVEFGVSPKVQSDEDFVRLFLTLGQLAPYCGTGHKTTFGLGQTRCGWSSEREEAVQTTIQDLLAERIEELTEAFVMQRKRTGGDRAMEIAKTWATILARRELGESLQDIALDLTMPYETVKTYAKLARRSWRDGGRREG